MSVRCSADIEQIKFGDSKFADLIKGFEDKNNRVFGAGVVWQDRNEDI